MDLSTYALTKKIAGSALSGVKSMSIDGTTLNIETNDGDVLSMVFPTPADGISVVGVNDKGNGAFALAFSDGTESDMINTVSGQRGLSAYEVAVANGFEGSETEWLETLNGGGLVLQEIKDYVDEQIGEQIGGALNGSY